MRPRTVALLVAVATIAVALNLRPAIVALSPLLAAKCSGGQTGESDLVPEQTAPGMGLLPGGPGLGVGNVHASSQAAPSGPTHLSDEHCTGQIRLSRLLIAGRF